MNRNPSPLQSLVLLQLVFTGAEPKQSELTQLKPKPRKELIDAGFIELEKRGRAQHIILTDKAWAWAGRNLNAEISRRAKTTDAFLGLLLRLHHFLQEKDISLAEFILCQPQVEDQPVDRHARVASAYLKLSGGKSNIRIRLRDLRHQLSEIPRDQLDAVLIEMQNRGQLVLMHLDDPSERAAADEAAAIDILGHKRHILYMEI